MADQFEGKRVPWQQFEEYLALHQGKIVTLQNMLANELAERPAIERMLPKPLFLIHQLLSRVLMDNGVLQAQSQINAKQIQLVVQTVMKLHGKVIAQYLENQEDMDGTIESMKSEIEEALGQQVQQEISRGFLENISGTTQLIQGIFSQLQESNQQHYQGVIDAITNEKTAKIRELEAQLKAKDIQIFDLKAFEGEQKDKEKTITILNRDNERLQQQVDSLSNGKDSKLGNLKEMQELLKIKEESIAQLKLQIEEKYQDAQAAITSNGQDQINLLKMKNEELRAKNIELEKLVQQLKEKTTQPANQNVTSQQDQQNIILPSPSATQILNSIIDQFLLKSKCATNDQQKQFLNQLLGNKRLVTILLFRGSEHGWMKKDFYSRCDKKGPTISLFQVKGGDCIGGFTTRQWQDVDPAKSVVDAHAFLFNLSSSRLFKGSTTGRIQCYTNRGPMFSSGVFSTELSANDEPFNGDNKCHSDGNRPGYQIDIDADGNNMLTNQKNGDFTITELEVWEVINVENLVLQEPVQVKRKAK